MHTLKINFFPWQWRWICSKLILFQSNHHQHYLAKNRTMCSGITHPLPPLRRWSVETSERWKPVREFYLRAFSQSVIDHLVLYFMNPPPLQYSHQIAPLSLVLCCVLGLDTIIIKQVCVNWRQAGVIIWPPAGSVTRARHDHKHRSKIPLSVFGHKHRSKIPLSVFGQKHRCHGENLDNRPRQ